jgi:hypothetical protein
MPVIRSFAIAVVLFFLAGQTWAQLLASPERAAVNSLNKKRWSKAEGQLRKALKKDSLNVTARYLLSVWFFKRENPAYNADSSYRYVMQSLSHYPHLSSRRRDRMRRFELDSARMISLRERIDSAVFTEVKAVHTEEAYIWFLQEHPYATQKNEALQLRDEVAYLNALNLNTHEAFLDYLNKYPLASNVPDARKKYHRLLYESRTSDRRLASYEEFLREYPETPFRLEIEQHIFELFTRSGEIERYLSFLQLYPSSHLVKKAQNILFHILLEQEDQQMAGLFLTDSLRLTLQLQESYLVPFLKNGKFGFMDKNGKEVIRPSLNHLSDEYKCGNITEDIIALPDKILARNGATVFTGKAEEIDDLGAGFLLVKSEKCTLILHKSGFVADSCVAGAKVLNNQFLSVLKDQQWHLVALNGKRLLPETWDEVTIHNTVVALKKKDQVYLVTLQQIAHGAEEYSLPLPNPYEEVKMLNHGMVWVKIQGKQGVLNQTLQEVIPLGDHVLTPTSFGFTGHSSEGYSIYDPAGKQSSSFERIMLHEPWITVRKNGSWYLFNRETQAYQSPPYDSIRFEGSFVLGISSDTLSVHFQDGYRESFRQPVITSFIPGKDSTSFLNIERDGKKTIYNAKGRKLFTVTYDQVQYAGEDLFIVHKKEKKGLINAEGKVILPVEYDAIGGATNNVISLLRSMKFGAYHVQQRKLIKPQYDKNLIPYTHRLMAAYRDGVYRLMNWDNKPEASVEFDEIQYWNDTTALIRKKEHWAFYTFATKEILYPELKAITRIRDTPDEKLAIIRQDNTFGVLSNKKGWVIPLTFSDLVNVGSEEEPLYFTEKHVEEASVFLVIYYDRNGKFLRREVYEETEDYEKIYCADN